MATDFGCDGFEAAAHLLDLDGHGGQGGGVLAAGAVLVDDGAQVGPAVESGPADLRACCYLSERDGLSGGGELGAGGLDPGRLVRSAGIGLADEQVEPVQEAAVAGGLVAPAAFGGVGGESFGVDSLQLQHREKGGVVAEVRAVLADVGVGARSLGGGA